MSRSRGSCRLETALIDIDGGLEVQSLWVHSGDTNIVSTVPTSTRFMMTRIYWTVTVGFNGTGSNTIDIGYQTLPTYWGQIADAGTPSVGVITPGKFENVSRVPRVRYNGIGATVGKALVVFEYGRMPQSPA